MPNFLSRHEKPISRIATVIVFIALIRCIGEPFRLQYASATPLMLEQVTPFLLGALLCAVSLLLMSLLSFWNQYKWITVSALLCIAGMVGVKIYFGL